MKSALLCFILLSVLVPLQGRTQDQPQVLGHANFIGGSGHDTMNSFAWINKESSQIGFEISMARKIAKEAMPELGAGIIQSLAGLSERTLIKIISAEQFNLALATNFDSKKADLITSGMDLEYRRGQVRNGIIQISDSFKGEECATSNYYYYEFLNRKGIAVYSFCTTAYYELLILDLKSIQSH